MGAIDKAIEKYGGLVEADPLAERATPLPDGITPQRALYLEMIGAIRLTDTQRRNARDLLPYTSPKLAVTVQATAGESFAKQMERIWYRTERARRLAPPPPQIINATEVTEQGPEGMGLTNGAPSQILERRMLSHEPVDPEVEPVERIRRRVRSRPAQFFSRH